jgi:hypothetical protein
MVDRERVGSELILGLKSLKWFLEKSAGLEQESAGELAELSFLQILAGVKYVTA